MTDRTLLLHLGYPKSGTTTLQAGLYRTAPNIFFMGKTHDEKMADPIIDRFRTMVNYGTLSHIRAQKTAITDRIAEIWQANGSNVALMSLEGLTNPFVDTHYTQPKDIFTKAEAIAEILEGLGVTTRCLVTLRAQTELMPSLFSQIFLQGFSSGLFKPNYDAFLDFMLGDEIIGFGPDFCFDAYLDHLAALFGADQVFAVSMKGVLADTPGRDTDVMARFMGLPEKDVITMIQGGGRQNVRNTGNKGRRMVMKSPGVNRFEDNTGLSLRRAAFGATALLKEKRHRPAHWRLPDHSARIAAYYETSNARLAERYGITF